MKFIPYFLKSSVILQLPHNVVMVLWFYLPIQDEKKTGNNEGFYPTSESANVDEPHGFSELSPREQVLSSSKKMLSRCNDNSIIQIFQGEVQSTS